MTPVMDEIRQLIEVTERKAAAEQRVADLLQSIYSALTALHAEAAASRIKNGELVAAIADIAARIGTLTQYLSTTLMTDTERARELLAKAVQSFGRETNDLVGALTEIAAKREEAMTNVTIGRSAGDVAVDHSHIVKATPVMTQTDVVFLTIDAASQIVEKNPQEAENLLSTLGVDALNIAKAGLSSGVIGVIQQTILSIINKILAKRAQPAT